MAAVQALNGDKWHDRYPELGTGPIPIEPYISRAYFEKEREQIFRKVWLNIGRIEQIPRPGDHFVTDLEVCKTSILVVRGKDGVIRAFHNMCSHRGNKLVWDNQGSCQAFTCQFHGWVYGLDDSAPKPTLRGVNPSHDPSWALDSCILFPNYVMYASEGTYLSHTFWPLAEDRTRWETRICFPEATTLAERFSQEYNKVVTRDTFMEDGTTLEKTQSMLASGAKKEIHLQDEELFIRQHHKVAETYLRSC